MRSLSLCIASPPLWLPPVEPDLHDCDINCTLCIFINITALLQNVCFVYFSVFMHVSSVLSSVLLFVGLLGSHGVLCDRGQR